MCRTARPSSIWCAGWTPGPIRKRRVHRPPGAEALLGRLRRPHGSALRSLRPPDRRGPHLPQRPGRALPPRGGACASARGYRSSASALGRGVGPSAWTGAAGRACGPPGGVPRRRGHSADIVRLKCYVPHPHPLESTGAGEGDRSVVADLGSQTVLHHGVELASRALQAPGPGRGRDGSGWSWPIGRPRRRVGPRRDPRRSRRAGAGRRRRRRGWPVSPSRVRVERVGPRHGRSRIPRD